ncbi:MAG: hypothetical protein HY907_19990 [Deltaproteobacteria bacterium]|nr:hypothetical protein [Deltaproteobacteria bacterium]
MGRSAGACCLGFLIVVVGPSCGETPRFGTMFEEVERMSWDSDYVDGRWEPDWDDAAFYGPAYYARVGWERGDETYRQRARDGVRHNLDEIIGTAVAGGVSAVADNMTEVLYAVLGVLDYMEVSGDLSGLDRIDESLDLADLIVSRLCADYCQGFPSYAMDTYGPTVVTGMIAIVYLQYAVLIDAPREAERVARAGEILARIEERAWNGSYYLFTPDRPDYLDLYPNVVMMIALARYHQATGDAGALERAEGLFEAIRPLRCTDRPGYKSLYSAEAMGARTDDYTTLSAMNYTMFALALLAEESGDPRYRDEIDWLEGFVEDYLYVEADGKVYHHWMDGRLALPTDLEYFCIGCNLQFLYVDWWVRHHLD